MRRDGTLGLLRDDRAAQLKRLLRPAGATLLVLAITSMGLGAAGCRVDEDDLHRWEGTERGPDKITSVLKHDKYEVPLRVEAAVSLIRMKPRKGKYVGIEQLGKTLDDIAGSEREAILAGLVPILLAELKKDPPAAQAGQPPPPDPSFAFKDAAYKLFTYEEEQLLVDPEQRRELKEALEYWAMKDFDRRLESKQQMYSMEQLLQLLGPEGVDQLPEKITNDARNFEKIADLVEKIGSQETKEAATVKLVEYTRWVLSREWLDAKAPIVREGNALRNLTPSEEDFKTQLDTYQDEELQRALSAIKKVGGRAGIEFGFELALEKDPKKVKEDRRVWALAAMELRLDPKNPKDIERSFQIAMDPESPDKVKDLAFARIGEMKREDVIDKLYEAFAKADPWKVRRAAGSLILRMSEVKHLDEFMGKLPDKDAKVFAIGEARTYGDHLIDFKDGDKPADIKKPLEKYLADTASPAQRGVAFGFYELQGLPDDIKQLEPFKEDKGPVPMCEGGKAAEGCVWECQVPKDEKKPEETELKEVKTFGEYVSYCVIPYIKYRAEEAKKAEAAKKDAL